MDYQNLSKEQLIMKLKEARIRLAEMEKNAKKHEKEEQILLSIIEKISVETGVSFFHSLTKYLANSLKMDYALVGELDANNNMVKTAY